MRFRSGYCLLKLDENFFSTVVMEHNNVRIIDKSLRLLLLFGFKRIVSNDVLTDESMRRKSSRRL